TVFAKTSLVGSEPGWTLNTAHNVLSGMPQDAKLFDMVTRSVILKNALIYSGNQFVDWEAGECHFDDDAFIHLLEFLKEFPEEIDYNADNQSPDSDFRENRVLAIMGQIGNLRDYNRLSKGMFGEEITMIGFPSDNGMGAAINTMQSFALSSKSKNIEGAWEFLRFYLTDEYQESPNSVYMLPISRKAFDQKAKEATEKAYYLDENNNKVEFDDIYYLDGQEITLSLMSQAELDKLVSYIMAVDTVGEYNEIIANIIDEEAAPYFAGQKSVLDAAEIIQSRVHIYVNELQ
ncbi:MAG: extracellular solute-binding protein, partial [Lachnospiraceae bacterium]|nr:extracellular solute-binding protein [Lachnospiraceae bacterium]